MIFRVNLRELVYTFIILQVFFLFYYFGAFKKSFHFNTCHLSELIRAIRMTPMKRVDIRDKAPMILQAKARLELIAVIKCRIYSSALVEKN